MSKKNKVYSSPTGCHTTEVISSCMKPNGPKGIKDLLINRKEFIEALHNEDGIDNMLWINNELAYEYTEENKYDAYIKYNDDIEILKEEIEDLRNSLDSIKYKIKFIPEIKQSKKCHSIIRKLIEKLQILTFFTAVGFVATATAFLHLLDWI